MAGGVAIAHHGQTLVLLTGLLVHTAARPRGQVLRMPKRMRRATRPVAHVWLPSLTTFNFLHENCVKNGNLQYRQRM